MINILFILPILFFLGALTLWFWDIKKNESIETLVKLSESTGAIHDPVNWKRTETAISNISDRLGKAGFLTHKQRLRARLILALIFIGFVALSIFISIQKETPLAIFVGLACGVYIGALTALYALRYWTDKFQREVAFNIPLLLENIILLVESGYGVLPALEQASLPTIKPNATKQLFHLVHQLSAFGLPFSKALEIVADAADMRILRHVLMHLDISNAEGGELIPSLRGLSEHAHHEWKMGVETRVKKLENFVVFPVFAAVLGLMLLISAVPLVPLLELRETMHNKKPVMGEMTNGIDHDLSVNGQ